MMKWIIAALLMLLLACQKAEKRKWQPIRTSDIPSHRTEIWNDLDGWSVGDQRYGDASGLLPVVRQSDAPVIIMLWKKSPLGSDDLIPLAEKFSEGGKRRVFYHQVRGNIDSIEESFEFTR